MQENFKNSWQEVINRLEDWLELLIKNLPNILLAILVIIFFFILSRYLKKWLRRPVKHLTKQESVRDLLVRVGSIVMIALGFLLALGILNLDTALKSALAGAGVAGLAIGLALQGTLSDTFSGVMLAVRQVINVGDYIKTNNYAGFVEKIELRNTWIRESDNNIVVIPNKDVLEKPFKNYGLTDRIRVTLKCGVAYSSDLDRVIQVADKSIQEKFPQENGEIEFYYTGFGESAIEFKLRFWVKAIKNRTILSSHSDAIRLLKKGFDEAGITIPFPIRTLHMHPQSEKFARDLVSEEGEKKEDSSN
ncbi:MAG TPA: mechanosensitive ion channel family protein [Saprospiraceae bacterium]|nr:mechanosensitive ion channel family protein [Saprospiraceae bacterium]